MDVGTSKFKSGKYRNMEKVTVKIELEREDISTLMFLAGGKLS